MQRTTPLRTIPLREISTKGQYRKLWEHAFAGYTSYGSIKYSTSFMNVVNELEKYDAIVAYDRIEFANEEGYIQFIMTWCGV